MGTANLILAEIEEHAPRAVVLCFGPDAATYRVELYPGYHAERPEMPADLAPQFGACGDFFGAFGWIVAEHDSLEADDLLGSYARVESEAGGRAPILTGDRDMFQCASDAVTVLYVKTGSRGAEQVTPDEVGRATGSRPELVPDFIALRGDPSDGLPGAKGVGEKTAAELLRRHGSLEARARARDRARRGRSSGPRCSAPATSCSRFKDIATLRDAGVERPPDAPTDWSALLRPRGRRGMNRLAERLEKLAGV